MSDFSDFGDFVRALFSQRRKVLRTSVARAARAWAGGFPDEARALAGHALAAAGVDPGERVERIAPERILAIWRAAREGR
jgi:16S rRNA A1518/A1519 N6-dimethyltransferase RsmA/KsgA/DIM1 with predicted DNA glycosylase/AP lyase activity